VTAQRPLVDEALAAQARAERHGHAATALALAGIAAMIADLEGQERRPAPRPAGPQD